MKRPSPKTRKSLWLSPEADAAIDALAERLAGEIYGNPARLRSMAACMLIRAGAESIEAARKKTCKKIAICS